MSSRGLTILKIGQYWQRDQHLEINSPETFPVSRGTKQVSLLLLILTDQSQQPTVLREHLVA